jgi:formate-dependent nitrite reductase membrane component NrfD
VVVCPTHSIWVGDLEDPTSGITRLVNNNPVSVRAPEQHTGPNVFYLGADRAVLDPLGAPTDGNYLYSRPDSHRAAVAADLPVDPVSNARLTLNTAHPRPWGWRVTTYLWIKAVAAGAMMLASFAQLVGIPLGGLGDVVAPVVGIAGVAITGALLVWDLKRPLRFLYIFLKPNPRSWLFWGSVVLAVGAALFVAWLTVGLLAVVGLLAGHTAHAVLTGLAGPTLVTAAMVTGYTGLLFGQAEGRDLWQSPLLFWHLIVQAVMVGAGALVIAGAVTGLSPGARALLVGALTLGTGVHVVMLLLEYLGRHSTSNAAAAAHMVTHGRYARTFWVGGIGLAVLAAALAVGGWLGPLACAVAGGVLVQAALAAYESVFIRAGQDVPLS